MEVYLLKNNFDVFTCVSDTTKENMLRFRKPRRKEMDLIKE